MELPNQIMQAYDLLHEANWALARWSEAYRAWDADHSLPKPSQLSLRRELNAIKQKQFPWMLEVTKNALQMAIIHLGRAFENFFAGRAVGDMGVGEFRRHMEYKMPLHGGTLMIANQWYPSSKLCCACGHKQEQLPLSVRSWTCPHCGAQHDRDLNAAMNLMQLAVSSTVTA